VVGGKDISPAVAAVTSMVTPAIPRKILSPNAGKIDPSRRDQYNRAVSESGGEFVPTAGQLTGDQKQINREFADSGKKVNEDQLNAVMKTATAPTGESTSRIDYGAPGTWVQRNAERTGNRIDELERTTSIGGRSNLTTPTGHTTFAYPEFPSIENSLKTTRPQDIDGILAKIKEADATLVPHRTAIPGEQIHSALFRRGGTGTLSGKQYNNIRQNLYAGATNPGLSPASQHSYRMVANALDNAMAQTGQGQNWENARRQWANTEVFKDLASKAKKGANQFTTDQIASASQRVMGKNPWTRGELENAPFISAAQAFQPLKKGKIPEKYPAYTKFPVFGPLGGHIMNWAPAIAGLGTVPAMHYMGYPAGEALTGGILAGMTAAVPKLANKVPPIIPPMNSLQQQRLKSETIQPGTYTNAAIRALFGNMSGQ